LDAEPRIVEHFTSFGAHPETVNLRYAPIGTTVIVTPSSLDKTPTTPYIEDTDYSVDRTNGTLSTVALGAFNAAGVDIKVTYFSRAQIMLTDMTNLIMAIGRDVRIERDRDIYAGVNQFAITTKIAVQVEEVTATVKGINIGLS
jgi:hypothetical protein